MLRRKPRYRREFYIPVILATAGIHPFAIFLCAKAQTAIYRRKWQTPAAAKPPVIMGGKAALHTAAFSHLALQDGLRYAQIAKMRR